jgi:hypothetical protein
LKTLEFDQKSQCKVIAQEAMISEESIAIKKKPSNLY